MRLLEMILKNLGNVRSLREAKQIQAQMLMTGLHQDAFCLCATKLVCVFLMQGSLEDARLVLDRMPISLPPPSSNSISNTWIWTAVMRSYAEKGLWQEAMEVFQQMQRYGIQPDKSSIPSVLKASAGLRGLQQGREIHGYVVANGFLLLDADVLVGNALVSMYAKCGLIDVARHVFDKMPQKNVVSWNSVLAGYTHNGEAYKALQLFKQMESECKPDSITVVALLSSCASLRALRTGEEIQGYAIRNYLESDVFVGNALVDIYAKNDRLGLALRVFERMSVRNRVSWNTMIGAYVQNDHGEEALQLFREMELACIKPDSISISCLLPACGLLADLQLGRGIHGYTIKSGLDKNVVVGNGLIHMYAKCATPQFARQVFDNMPHRDVVSWNAIIGGFAFCGHYVESLQLFNDMNLLGMKPNSITIAIVLPACSCLGALKQGKAIHNYLLRNEHVFEIFVTNALIDMYVKCGSIEDACQLFENITERDVVSWNVIVGCTLTRRNYRTSWNFCQMRLDGVKPDSITIANSLTGCARTGALKQGKEVHCYLIINGFELYVSLENALIDMYAKCGSVEDARHMFDKMTKRDVVSWTAMIAGYAQNGQVDEALALFQQMPERNVVSWTAMIAGYAQNGRCAEALEFFKQMQLAGVMPKPKTFASVLPVCANLAALEQGMQIHELINRSGFQSDVSVVNALMDMYAKCGKIDEACELFGKMHQRNVVSWTTMIAGYAMHGFGKEALEIFEQMRYNGARPNHITFIGVLSACCHAGLVDEGYRYFNCMSECYKIVPAMEHYSIMVDLLGRAGYLDEARDFINKMPIKPSATVLGSLLGACKIYQNIELGEQVAEVFFELIPQNAAPYLLLSNIYAAAGRWGDVEKVQKMMKDRGVKKMSGCSWIEVNKQVHGFLVGQMSHIQS